MDSVVVRTDSEHVTLTLVALDPAEDLGRMDAFLDRYAGPGVQHLAFQVDDIFVAVEQFQIRGVGFLTTPAAYYDMLAEWFQDIRHEEISALCEANALADRDEWGYLLLLLSRSPYERNTLFYGLIQRRGSRGFGSRNIRALYEAVERNRLDTE